MLSPLSYVCFTFVVYIANNIDLDHTAKEQSDQGSKAVLLLLIICYLSCVCHAIASVDCCLKVTEGKLLTSWLLFVMLIMILLLSHLVSGTGEVLDCIDS